MTDTVWTRRRCVCTLGLSVLAVPLARASWAVAAGDGLPDGATAEKGVATSERWIELKNIHTGEAVKAAFGKRSGPDAATLARLQYVLRDYRVNEEHAMDPGLFEQLSDFAKAAGREPRYEIISGYRSPTTNAMLASLSDGVAQHSFHLQGKAMDIRVPGRSLRHVRTAAMALQGGGVGYYPHSDFVHIDTGPLRHW